MNGSHSTSEMGPELEPSSEHGVHGLWGCHYARPRHWPSCEREKTQVLDALETLGEQPLYNRSRMEMPPIGLGKAV